MTYDPLIFRGVSSMLSAPKSNWHATHKVSTLPPLNKKVNTKYLVIGFSFAAFAGQCLAQRIMGTNDVNLSLAIYQSPVKTYPFPKARRLAQHGLYQSAKIAER